MGYAYSNSGLSFRAWDDSSTITTGEVYFNHEPTTTELAAAFSGYTAAVLSVKKKALDAEYEEYYVNLDKAYAAASQCGNTTQATAIAAKRVELVAAHKTAKEALV